MKKFFIPTCPINAAFITTLKKTLHVIKEDQRWFETKNNGFNIEPREREQVKKYRLIHALVTLV